MDGAERLAELTPRRRITALLTVLAAYAVMLVGLGTLNRLVGGV